MKKNYLLTLVLSLFCVIRSFSQQDVEIDGLFYSLHSSSASATVLSAGRDELGNRILYSGKLTIPEAVVYGDVEYKVDYIQSSAFSNQPGLVSVSMPKGIHVGEYAFCNCTGLTSITVPATWTIHPWTFSGCTGLVSVSIPEGVTNIAHHAFSGCTGLESLTIPSTIMDIRGTAFDNCTSLKDVYSYLDPLYYYEQPEAGNTMRYAVFVAEDAFGSTPLGNVTLHVPAQYLEAYQQEAPWNQFGKIVAEGDVPASETSVVSPAQSPIPIQYYSLDGTRVRSPRRGISIMRMNDGTVRKGVIRE